LYFLGRFSIATLGFQGSSVNCGELHVTYQVRLLKPKLFTTLGDTIPFYSARWGNATTSVFTSANPLKDAVNGLPPASTIGNVEVTYAVGPPNTLAITVNTGMTTWLVTVFWFGVVTAAAWVAPAITVTNGSLLGLVQVPDSTVDAATSCTETVLVQSDGSGKPLTIGYGAAGSLPTTSNQFSVNLVQVNPSLIAFQ